MSCTTCDLCKKRAAGEPVVRLDPMRLVTPQDMRPKVKLTKALVERIQSVLYNSGRDTLLDAITEELNR